MTNWVVRHKVLAALLLAGVLLLVSGLVFGSGEQVPLPPEEIRD